MSRPAWLIFAALAATLALPASALAGGNRDRDRRDRDDDRRDRDHRDRDDDDRDRDDDRGGSHADEDDDEHDCRHSRCRHHRGHGCKVRVRITHRASAWAPPQTLCLSISAAIQHLCRHRYDRIACPPLCHCDDEPPPPPPANEPPVVTITIVGNPSQNGDTFIIETTGSTANVQFTGTAIDGSDNLSAGLAWAGTPGSLSDASGSDASGTFSLGTHTVTASVTDTGTPALTGTASVKFEVKDAAPPQITQILANGVAVDLVSKAVTLQATSADPLSVTFAGTATDNNPQATPVVTFERTSGVGDKFEVGKTELVTAKASDGSLESSVEFAVTVTAASSDRVYIAARSGSGQRVYAYAATGTSGQPLAQSAEYPESNGGAVLATATGVYLAALGAVVELDPTTLVESSRISVVSPASLAADGKGRLYVGDSTGMTIAIFDQKSGAQLLEIALSGQPHGLYVASASLDAATILVSVQGDQPSVQAFDVDGLSGGQAAETLVATVTGPGQFNEPHGLTVVGSRVLVADPNGSGPARVVAFSTALLGQSTAQIDFDNSTIVAPTINSAFVLAGLIDLVGDPADGSVVVSTAGGYVRLDVSTIKASGLDSDAPEAVFFDPSSNADLPLGVGLLKE